LGLNLAEKEYRIILKQDYKYCIIYSDITAFSAPVPNLLFALSMDDLLPWIFDEELRG